MLFAGHLLRYFLLGVGPLDALDQLGRGGAFQHCDDVAERPGCLGPDSRIRVGSEQRREAAGRLGALTPKQALITGAQCLGTVVGIYIDDAAIRDGRFDTAAVRPLARMGYMDYAVVTPETTFEMKRPQVADDGRSVVVDTGAWDGVYR